jgi:hypothetical protein
MSVLFHLYSSEGCHLCEQALALIADVIPDHQIKVVDIIDANVEGASVDSEQNLVELYGVHIPVLERLSDNAKLFWPFEQSQVVELI